MNITKFFDIKKYHDAESIEILLSRGIKDSYILDTVDGIKVTEKYDCANYGHIYNYAGRDNVDCARYCLEKLPSVDYERLLRSSKSKDMARIVLEKHLFQHDVLKRCIEQMSSTDAISYILDKVPDIITDELIQNACSFNHIVLEILVDKGVLLNNRVIDKRITTTERLIKFFNAGCVFDKSKFVTCYDAEGYKFALSKGLKIYRQNAKHLMYRKDDEQLFSLLDGAKPLNYVSVAQSSIKSNKEKLFLASSKKISNEDMFNLADYINTNTNVNILNEFTLRGTMKPERAFVIFFHAMEKNEEDKARILLPFVKLTEIQKQILSQLKD